MRVAENSGKQERENVPQSVAPPASQGANETAPEADRLFRDWLRGELRPEMRVLNLGAGSSTPGSVPIRKGEVRELVGASSDRSLLNDPSFDHTVRIENDWLPLADRSFDLIWCENGLEHWERPGAMLAEVHRLLKPGGQFFFLTPNFLHHRTLRQWITSDGIWSRLDRFLGGKGPVTLSANRHFLRVNTRATLKRLALAAGFTETELRMVEAGSSGQELRRRAETWDARYGRLVNRTEHLAGLRATILGRLRR